MDLSGGLETAAPPMGPVPLEEDLMFELYDSEELLGTEAGEIAESSPLHSSAYEELVDALSRAVVKLNINWPQEKQEVQVKSELDERFLQHSSQPQRRGLQFYPDLHNELCMSWNKRLLDDTLG